MNKESQAPAAPQDQHSDTAAARRETSVSPDVVATHRRLLKATEQRCLDAAARRGDGVWSAALIRQEVRLSSSTISRALRTLIRRGYARHTEFYYYRQLTPLGRAIAMPEGQKLLTMLLWKLRGREMVRLTLEDMKRFEAEFAPGIPVLYTHGHYDSIDFQVVDEAAATRISEHDKTQRGRA